MEEAEGSPGAAGLRTIQGYLYYRKTGTNHAAAPSAPSGNTYNFTGTYAGLVTDSGINTATSSQNNQWQNQPQTTNAAAQETVWAIRYYGTEASSGLL